MREARPSYPDLVVDRYLHDVDRSLLRRNLQLDHEARLNQLQELTRLAKELRKAGRETRATDSP